MNKATINNLFLCFSIVLMGSCRPALKVSSDYDRTVNFSGYKTFSLYYLATSKTVSELNEERLWNSVRAEMTKKGYVENDQQPDLVVNAVSILKDKKYISANSAFNGIGGAYRPYGYWRGGGTASAHTTFQTNDFKQGSLHIEIIDFRTNKIVWEGTGKAEFEKRPADPDKAITSAVNKILASFPQGHTNNFPTMEVNKN